MKKEDIYFVRIDEPSELRRTLLESSKTVVRSLQMYEALRVLRVEKVEEIMNLKKRISELDLLISKLKRSLPKSKKPNIDFERKENIRNIRNIRVEPKEEGNELLRLERELREIENKLSNIEK